MRYYKKRRILPRGLNQKKQLLKNSEAVFFMVLTYLTLKTFLKRGINNSANTPPSSAYTMTLSVTWELSDAATDADGFK